MLKMVNKR